LTVLATVIAAFYMYSKASEYQATTEMLIEPRKPAITSRDSININFGNDVNYYNTQLQLLQNADLMKKVVIGLGLHREPNLFANESRGIATTLRSIFSSAKPDAEHAESLPVISDVSSGSDKPVLSPEEERRAIEYAARFAGGLRVEQRERTNLVNVSVISSNPILAAKVADKVAETFRDEDGDRETQGSQRAADDLRRSIDELRETITNQEADLMNVLRSNDLPLQEKGQDLAMTRLQGLSDTWTKALENRRQIEARYNTAVQAGNRGEGANIPDLYENKIYQDTVRLNTERKAKLQDDIRSIERQISELEVKKQAALVRYTEEYQGVKDLNAQIAALKESKNRTEAEVSQIIAKDQKQIEKSAVSGALVSLRAQLDAARKQEQQAQAAYDQESARANVQGVAQTRLTTLKREIETNRTLLDTYTQRLKEQELQIASGRPDNIKIASNAVAPVEPIGPPRNRNILIAFLVSLLGGIGLAFLLDYLDNSVKSSDDISRLLGLPTLALIPHHAAGEKRRLSIAAKNGNGGMPSTAMISLDERNSVMAEAYRHLRTSLLFSSAGKPPQTILITSSQPAEGKTTTAINTAITLAQSDADVVIVDCDLRRPRVHSYFSMDNSHGLTNYLSGERDPDNLIRPSGQLPRLKVITSGPIPPNPAELLSSDEMKGLLTFLSSRYKHIIIDSPPAISFTDAAILATLVDGVVLVAMANKSSTHLMRRFKQRLGNLGARIYGVVLNGLKSGSVEYDYYGSGYYRYYNRSEVDDSTPLLEEVDTNGSSRQV
jgi:capsular exopolysaccharide synthesis family protein